MWSFGCVVLELCTGSILPSTFCQLAKKTEEGTSQLIEQTIPPEGDLNSCGSWARITLANTLKV